MILLGSNYDLNSYIVHTNSDSRGYFHSLSRDKQIVDGRAPVNSAIIVGPSVVSIRRPQENILVVE